MRAVFHGLHPLVDHSGMNLGLKILYDYPEKLGADRICNAVAAYQTYGGPLAVVDFGTATSFSVVDGEGAFLGGLICPGLMVSADALVTKAAQLSKVEFLPPTPGHRDKHGGRYPGGTYPRVCGAGGLHYPADRGGAGV